jgi:hypothetical protein
LKAIGISSGSRLEVQLPKRGLDTGGAGMISKSDSTHNNQLSHLRIGMDIGEFLILSFAIAYALTNCFWIPPAGHPVEN